MQGLRMKHFADRHLHWLDFTIRSFSSKAAPSIYVSNWFPWSFCWHYTVVGEITICKLYATAL